ncbi:MAG: DUF368 domain-containing protein [Myxococcota bacterium]
MSLPALGVRAGLGGSLMGLANLVPGISGGTMLLATGLYPAFIGAIAELTTLRFRLRSVALLASIASAAAVVILLLAGPMKTLVVEERWVMYSVFIGLTLGGVPLVWRLARPATPAVFVGAALAFGLMLALQLERSSAQNAGEPSFLMLMLSGLAGASAMILPGVSGGYLLLLLGQYERILGAIDQIKRGLLGGDGAGPDVALLVEAMDVVIPVGIGVFLGVVGVSNLLKWLLDRFEKPTLGGLLGLLFGAVVGLWPFQQPVAPQPGDIVAGRVMSTATLERLEEEDWPIERFRPTPLQSSTALGLLFAGLAGTLMIDRIGSGDQEGVPGTEATPSS